MEFKKIGEYMENNNHKISFKIHNRSISVYIDRDRINPIGFYPLNEYGKRLSEEEMGKL